MKKTLHVSISIALLAIVLLFGGCKKSTINGLVAMRSESNTQNGVTTNTTYTFTYDNQSRLTEEQISNGTPIIYTYNSGSVTETQGSTVTVYQLNSSGLATSATQGAASVTFVYNNGYCTSITSGSYSQVNTISNGNIVNQSITSAGVTTNNIYTYLSNTDYRSYGQSFLGSNSTNLVNSETQSSAGATTVFTYSYTYDSEGRVQTSTILYGSNTSTYTYTYTN